MKKDWLPEHETPLFEGAAHEVEAGAQHTALHASWRDGRFREFVRDQLQGAYEQGFEAGVCAEGTRTMHRDQCMMGDLVVHALNSVVEKGGDS